MLDESCMVGKRIKRMEVGGFGVLIVLEDGTIFDYTSSDGGYSYWDVIIEPTAEPLCEKTMDDLIGRKWLMECVEEGWIEFDTEKDKNRFIHLVRDIAPSAKKTGKWIDSYDLQGNHYKRCSECGAHIDATFFANDYLVNFCPNCGSDNRGVE